MSRVIAACVVVAAVSGFSSIAQSQLFGFEDCWFAVKPASSVGLGSELARADRLDAAAAEYDDFPYEQCFRLGRSCAQISIELDEAAFGRAHAECRFFYPDLDVSGFDAWRVQRIAYNECMANRFRLEASEIRASIFGEGDEPPTLADVMRGGTGPLTVNELKTISTDVTWCPTGRPGFRAAISCAGGGFVVGTFQGESRLTHRVSGDGRLCLSDFLNPETCHEVVRTGGALELDPPHATVTGAFTTVAGVEGGGAWNQSCRPG